jgi:hypothetical protein
MNKKLIFSVMLVFLLVFGLVAVSCGSGSSKLTGVWESEDGSSLEFFKDGTGKDERGTSLIWTAEKNRLMITVGGHAFSADYKLSGSTLILTFDNNPPQIFIKKANLSNTKVDSKLTGVWESEDHSRLEFFKDGTGNDYGHSLTWRTENNRLYITYVELGNGSLSCEYKLSGSKLTLTLEGENTIYNKIK